MPVPLTFFRAMREREPSSEATSFFSFANFSSSALRKAILRACHARCIFFA